MSTPLSVRNNNPGNIRQAGGEFANYETPQAGFNAMRRDLLAKLSGNSPIMRERYGEGYIPTLRNVISTWAPPSENNTVNYINVVASQSGIDPDAPLSQEDVDAIVPAMVRMEGGTEAANYYKQYADSGQIMNDASPAAPPKNRLAVYLEAEKRGILPADKAGLLAEARKRGLIPGGEQAALKEQATAPQPDIIDQLGRQVGLAARYGVEGLAALPGIVANPVIAAYNAATPEDWQKLNTVDQAVSNSLTGLGLPQPETAAERVVGDVTRAITGTGGVIKTAQAAAKGAGPIVQAVANAAAEAPITQLASTAAGVGTASALDEAGANPVTQLLVGSLAAAIPAAGRPASARAGAKAVKEGAKTVAQGFKSRSVEALDEATALMKNKASELYREAREGGVIIKPQSSADLVRRIEQAVQSSGRMNKRIHADTLSVIDDLKAAVKGGDLSLEELDQFRQLFGDAASKNYMNNKPDTMKATQAIEALDSFVKTLKPKNLLSGDINAAALLYRGRSEWSRYKKFDAITNIIRQADGDPNRLKSALQKFAQKRMQGFTAEEKRAIREAAKNTTAEKLFKAFGKFGFDLGGSMTPGNTALPAFAVLGGYGGLPGGIPAAIGGTAAREVQKALARGKAEQVLQTIAGQ